MAKQVRDQNVQSPLPEDHPLLVAWKAYRETSDYANHERWAREQEHTEGSLWGAFSFGWFTVKDQETNK